MRKEQIQDKIDIVNDMYEGVMQTVKWRKVKAPVDKDPFSDDKW